jgi:UDPglucose 6-dehydrogenase
MNVAIIGTGYVGLTTGVCLSDLGHQVVCVDNNPDKLQLLKNKKSPIFEEGIEELIIKNVDEDRLSFTDDLTSAVNQSEIIFICVNTPPKEDGQADLKYIEKVAKQIAGLLKPSEYKLIVDKSTVPVKTAEKVRETITRYASAEVLFDVVSNPEFLREGTAVYDTFNPDRIVIGADNDKARDILIDLYQPLITKINPPVKVVSVRSAELIKHGANTFLATKISFANMIADVCEQAGADAAEVLEAIGLDDRIGPKFLKPGIGFGGSCFPKDIAAFKKTMEVLGLESDFIKAVENINSKALLRFVKKIEKELWVVDGKNICVLGLAFKANTDDVRNSPAISLIKKLLADGAKINAYDPQAMDNAQKILPEITYHQDIYQAAKDCEALVIATEWQEFKEIDLTKLKSVLAVPIIFDARNLLDPKTAKEAGFNYFGVGR